ncbi:MAG: HAD hydrolase family protein [Streptococcus thermophilus]
MKFVFDLDGTLCFDGMTMSKDLQKVLLTAPKYGHEIIFATARSYRDCLSVLEGELRKLTVVSLNGGEVFQDERLVSQYRIPSSALRTIVSYCDIYNLPLNKARILSIHELNEPVKVVIPLVEHEDICEDLIFNLNKLECLDLSYHDIERCLYINPKGVTKASTVLNHFGKDFVAFGNDQNDISLFKNAIYGVQIGDYPYLNNFADEVIPAINAVIAEKIRLLFEKF